MSLPMIDIIVAAFAAVLTVLGVFGMRPLRRQYRAHQDRREDRDMLRDTVISIGGRSYQRCARGKHRTQHYRRPHRLCAEHQQCAYRDRGYGRTRARTYILRAEQEAREAALHNTGLLCGYRTPTPSSLPGLRMWDGSTVDLTAVSTSMPREPISVGRKSA